jgi:TRAP-type uncharacterized transport system fused permease subunit
LAPYAAAAITGGDPMRTTLLAWKYTLPAFLVPFAFTLAPDGLGLLLQAPIGTVLRTSFSAAIGVAALAIGVGGWLRAATTNLERIGAVAAGLLLIYPRAAADVVGLMLFAAVTAAHLLRLRRESGQHTASPGLR